MDMLLSLLRGNRFTEISFQSDQYQRKYQRKSYLKRGVLTRIRYFFNILKSRDSLPCNNLSGGVLIYERFYLRFVSNNDRG